MHYSMYNISVFKVVDELKRKKKKCNKLHEKICFLLNFVLCSNFNLVYSLYFTLYSNILC